MGVFEFAILMFLMGLASALPLTVMHYSQSSYWWLMQVLCVVRKAHIPSSMSSMSFMF